MAINYDALMATQVDDELCVYTDKDAMLYALGVGFGGNPLDRKELPYVYEGAGLKMPAAIPSKRTMSRCTRVVAIASSMPVAASMLPLAAVRGDESRFSPTMKQAEAARYASGSQVWLTSLCALGS